MGILIALLIVGGLFWLGYSWWRDVRELDELAHAAYDTLQAKQNESPLRTLNKEDFIDLYSHVHRVRFQKYFLLFLLFGFLFMPLTLMLGGVFKQLTVFLEETVYIGSIIQGFATFFFVLLGWVGAVALTLRIYHTRSPGTIEDEYHNKFET